MSESSKENWRFWIDTGGTFTDCLARMPDGRELRVKVLSNGAIRGRVVERLGPRTARVEVSVKTGDGFFVGYSLRLHGVEGEAMGIVDWSGSEGVVEVEGELPAECAGGLFSFQSPEEPPTLAARLLTGKRLDEALPDMSMRLATTRGTNALLEGKGARIAFFVNSGFRDLLRIGNQQRPDLFELGIETPPPLYSIVFEVSGRIDAEGNELKVLDEGEIRAFGRDCRNAGIDAVAVALLHSFANPQHEQRVARILKEEGLNDVSLSSELAPMIKIAPRAETSVVNAYLAPIMERYLESVQSTLPDDALKIMTSAGGLVSRSSYHPKDSLLSGPAGGVVGASSVGVRAGNARSIAFDMGGTSTDVSRFDGRLDYRFEQRIGAAHVFAPSLRIETVAAGGGSICWFDGSAFRVGPQSAGASPGPACYGAGGPLTLTDVNLLMGRLDGERFGIPVFPEDARSRFNELLAEAETHSGKRLDEASVLEGLLAIANERMAEAIRGISLREGYAPSEYALVAFGGAGGMHVCSVADILEVDTILFPADAGLLSAYGLQQARIERIRERQVLALLSDCVDSLASWVEDLRKDAVEALAEEGEESALANLLFAQVEMRFLGQETSLLIDFSGAGDVETEFRSQFETQYGFQPEQPIEVVSLKVSVGIEVDADESEEFSELRFLDTNRGESRPRGDLEAGTRLSGPLVIQDPFSTVFVDEGWNALVGSKGSMRLWRESKAATATSSDLIAVDLELYTNRFLSLVDEMGKLLERSAFSTNVKERKDFSCALLDSDGFLVANAPHIPVHLGALGVCVRAVREHMDFGPGDVVITNHPGYGGSHLPDVTLIAAVYSESGEHIGYVANRAHHAELGGISPGSMPPDAKSLEEEGVVIPPMYLVRGGEVDWDAITAVLTTSRYPTRRLKENLSDIAAQLGSIRIGASELQGLSSREGNDVVAFFMDALKRRAADALQRALRGLTFGSRSAVERLDSGAEIAVRVNDSGEKWLIDFSGSAPVQNSNYNATPAIVTSATIYVLRLLANEPIPLNEGFLHWVAIETPRGMLNPEFSDDPAECPPVVAGNVEVSQRIVDTLIRAFGLAAGSQGTMNNLIFGNERVSYYETIAGGEGATSERPGASGKHTHMTNTAITDPEILEWRFPVRLERFEIRAGSGGSGRYRGGDGLGRRIRFLEPVEVSLLTQHRESPPRGMDGGGSGAVGSQHKIDRHGNRTPLAGNGSCRFEAGEAIEIYTPGGGGWGVED